MNLGYIGLGLMGTPMVRRLLQAGFEVTVWNRDSAKTVPLVDTGAQEAQTIAELVSRSDVVMLSLSDTIAVEQVAFGDGGICTTGNQGKMLVDFSSIDPEATQRFSRRLGKDCGMHWVDAPVSGGVAGAEQGTLVIMAGGNRGDLELLEPVFEALASRVTHMGEVGAGQTTKICNQMIVGCNAVVIAEMMALARKTNIDVSKLTGALRGGFADSIPFQILVPQMADHNFAMRWKVATLLKDLQTAVTVAEQVGSQASFSRLACRIMKQHADAGYLDADLSTLIKAYEA